MNSFIVALSLLKVTGEIAQWYWVIYKAVSSRPEDAKENKLVEVEAKSGFEWIR